MNPLAPVQETLCLLQNETMATNPSAQPQRAVSLYYMVKLHVRTSEYIIIIVWGRNVRVSGAVPMRTEEERREGEGMRRSRKPQVEECSYNCGLGRLGGKTWSFRKMDN